MPSQIQCKKCDLYFNSKKSLDAHLIYSHKTQDASIKKVLILGGGFSGINILKEIQKIFGKTNKVSITIINQDNFFLFTPMLPQVATGILHPSDIAIPIRRFCKNSKFYQAKVSSIDLKQKLVTITRIFDGKVHALDYDYLILALGSKTNYFGNKNMEEYSFTIKTIEDAISIRNHAINMLENAEQTGDPELQKKYLTFTVVGAGFAGVETIGELNHFVRGAVKDSYPNIDKENIKILLVSSRKRILPEVNEKLGKDALSYLRNVGVDVITEAKAIDVSEDHVELSTSQIIPCTTVIWTGGVSIDPVISSLDCEHGSSGKVIVDQFLRLSTNPEVFALGDCAAIKDSTGKLYPPTAQHAIQESKIVVSNLKNSISNGNLQKFAYHSKGMMATIGNHVGVVSIFGRNLKGIPAWFMWRSYYLARIPTFEKKVKVAVDWSIDEFFKRDLTSIGKIKKKTLQKFHIADQIPTLKEQLFSDL